MRVASVPASHVYVRHLGDLDGADGVVRLPDPVPADGRTVPGGWWPPLMLEPGWVTDNHHRFDVFHVHFGFDAISPQALAEVMQELKMHNKPLVYTVHDLRNPHHHEPVAHRERQDVLVAAASALITLTSGAAQVISQQWGRSATVLPHPHVLDSGRMETPRRQPEPFVVALHVKSRRANMDPLPVLDTLAEAVAGLPGAVLQINVHDEVFEPGNHWYAPEFGAALLDYGSLPHVRVHVLPYFTEDELWDYLSSVRVSVLPYRFGTHSGWLEACYDLGTEVIAPSCGFYREQRPCGEYGFAEDGFDPDSLHRAVAKAHFRWAAGQPAPRATWSQRRAERAVLGRAHREIYAQVLA
ncbi:glycosyltransferase [Mycolicibacterium mengxianglii]|uniref:glycosyltransferase n=1 Tax=Mycolicibacterium mengxianglii TaxID=2736649 RepID=UPI0018D02056|nr:glycosyltransferase [Mycolicibacterium mengxianglii]